MLVEVEVAAAEAKVVFVVTFFHDEGHAAGRDAGEGGLEDDLG